MKYFILWDEKQKKYFCRVQVEDHECSVLNDNYDTYIRSQCYGEYKVYTMTKEQFDKGKITPIHTLQTIGKFVMSLGYYPY